MFLKPAGEPAVGVGEGVGQREWGVAVIPKSAASGKWLRSTWQGAGVWKAGAAVPQVLLGKVSLLSLGQDTRAVCGCRKAAEVMNPLRFDFYPKKRLE